MAKRKVEIQITAKDRASKTLKNLATGALAGIGVAAGLAAGNIAASLGRELIRTAQLIIEIGAGFEKSMSGVKAITRGTASEMAALEKVARKLGKSTVFTANNAAQAMEQFSLAGFSVNEVLRATPAALDLAAAGQLSMAEAADITSNVLRQFNIDAEETTRVVDILAGAATTSNQTIRDIGQAMTFAGITADALGVSLTETAALLGKLADRGLKASLGGTALRRTFAVFLGQLEPGEEGLKGFNAALARNEDGSFSFAKALDQLRDSGMTSGDVMKAFGQRAGPAMVALLGLGGEEIANYTAEIANMGGVAKRVGEERLQNLSGDFTRLTSAMTESALLIFDEAVPALRSLTQTALSTVTAINDVWVSFVTMRQAIIDAGKSLDELELDTTTDPARRLVLQLRILEEQFAKNERGIVALSKRTDLLGAVEFRAMLGIGNLTEANAILRGEIRELEAAQEAATEKTKEAADETGRLADETERLAAAKVKFRADEAARTLDIFGPSVTPDIFPVSGGAPFIGPGADGGDDGGLQDGLDAFLDAEERKQEQIRATAQALIESKLLIAETEEEAIAVQVELEILAFDEELERLEGNKEAIENLEEAHQNRMDALAKRTADNKKRREEEEAKRLKSFQKATVDQALATATAIFGNNKALSIASAIINTARGITGALAFEPWTPLNFVMAALVAAAGAAEIATIASSKFAHGGLVRGGVPGLDSVPALLTPGEFVISAPLVRELERAGVGAAGIAGDAGSFPAGGGGAAIQVFNTFNVDGGADVGEDGEGLPTNLRDLLEGINDLVIQSGGELVATSVLKNGTPTVAEEL